MSSDGTAGAAPARAVRTAVPASAAVLVAVGGHLAGGGTAPAPLVLLLTAVAAGALAHRLSAHRWTARTLVGLLALLQAAVHLVCSLPVGASGHHAAAMGPAAEAAPAWGMPAWHAAATLVTAALLLWGERLLWALLDALGLDRLAGPSAPVPCPASPGASLLPADETDPARRLLVAGGGVRGPPRAR